MAKASIFDLLNQRHAPVVGPQDASAERSDYRTDRLRLIDGVALTAAGVVAAGEVPEPGPLEQAQDLYGSDGFRVLVQAVREVMPVDEPRLKRLDAKAMRLHALIQTLLIDALMLLDDLPEGAGFDIVLSAPLRAPGAVEIVTERLRSAVEATDHGQGLGDVRHGATGWDPHATLAVSEAGGMPYVLWLCADSLLNPDDIAWLHQRRLLALASRQEGMYPGEAAAALLVQRVLEREPGEDATVSTGWWLDPAAVLEHAERSTLSTRARHQAMRDLLAQAWPEAEEAGAPAFLAMDGLGLPGRTLEVAGPLIERWPALDVIEHGLSVDAWCGWPGEALTPLQLVLALASLAPKQDGLVLNLAEERRTRALVLQGCAQAEATNEDTPVAATSPADGRGS